MPHVVVLCTSLLPLPPQSLESTPPFVTPFQARAPPARSGGGGPARRDHPAGCSRSGACEAAHHRGGEGAAAPKPAEAIPLPILPLPYSSLHFPHRIHTLSCHLGRSCAPSLSPRSRRESWSRGLEEGRARSRQRSYANGGTPALTADRSISTPPRGFLARQGICTPPYSGAGRGGGRGGASQQGLSSLVEEDAFPAPAPGEEIPGYGAGGRPSSAQARSAELPVAKVEEKPVRRRRASLGANNERLLTLT